MNSSKTQLIKKLKYINLKRNLMKYQVNKMKAAKFKIIQQRC